MSALPDLVGREEHKGLYLIDEMAAPGDHYAVVRSDVLKTSSATQRQRLRRRNGAQCQQCVDQEHTVLSPTVSAGGYTFNQGHQGR